MDRGAKDITTPAVTVHETFIIDPVTKLPVSPLGSASAPTTVQGGAALDAPVSGNPVRIGGRYNSAAASVSATGDTTDINTNIYGSIIVAAEGAIMSDGLSSTLTGLTDRAGAARPLGVATFSWDGSTWNRTGGVPVSINAVPTVSASPAYSVGDVVGTKMTFTGIAIRAAGAGIIQEVTVNCKSAQTAELDLILFKADPSSSTFTDNAALAVNSADFDKVLAVIHLADWTNLGTPSTCQGTNLSLPFRLASGTAVYGVLVARAALTLGSTSDLSVDLRAMPL